MSAPTVPPQYDEQGNLVQFTGNLTDQGQGGITLRQGESVSDADYRGGRRSSGGGRRGGRSRRGGGSRRRGRTSFSSSNPNDTTGTRPAKDERPEKAERTGSPKVKALEEVLKNAPDWAKKYSGAPARSEYPPTPVDQEFLLENPGSRSQNKFDARFGRGAMRRSYFTGPDTGGMNLGKNPDYDQMYQDAIRRAGIEPDAAPAARTTAASTPAVDDAALLAYVQKTMGKGGWDEEAPAQTAKPAEAPAKPAEKPAEKGYWDSIKDAVMDRLKQSQ